MVDYIQDRSRKLLKQLLLLFKWLLISAITGMIGGVLGSLFHFSVEYVTEFRAGHPYILYTLPLGGALIALAYTKCKMEHVGTNQVLDSIHEGKRLPLKLIPLIFGGTVITHLCGGSAGREGAALQLGGTVGDHVGRIFKLDERDRRLITMCGMASVFSALFGTPLTASFFAMEVTSVGVWYYAGLIPCLTAALCAYGASLLFGLAPTRFVLNSLPALGALNLGRVALLAALAACVSILFCLALHKTEHWADRFIPKAWLRGAIGGAALIILTLLVGNYDYNGAGMGIIQSAIGGSARPEAFLLKIIFTAITIGCGFKGGEVVPSFFVGATFGCIAGPLLGLPAGFSAAIGLVCVFCGVVNCPIASIFLSLELFGAEGVVFFAVACAISFVLSGNYSLYASQHIVYSKLHAQYVNQKTH